MDTYQTAQDIRSGIDAITFIAKVMGDYAWDDEAMTQGEWEGVANRLETLLMGCELCGDERLLEDINPDTQRCTPCDEREGDDDSDEYDPYDGPCHGCGIDRPDWRSRAQCDMCGVGLCWNCVAMHQCNWPQAPRRS